MTAVDYAAATLSTGGGGFCAKHVLYMYYTVTVGMSNAVLFLTHPCCLALIVVAEYNLELTLHSQSLLHAIVFDPPINARVALWPNYKLTCNVRLQLVRASSAGVWVWCFKAVSEQFAHSRVRP